MQSPKVMLAFSVGDLYLSHDQHCCSSWPGVSLHHCEVSRAEVLWHFLSCRSVSAALQLLRKFVPLVLYLLGLSHVCCLEIITWVINIFLHSSTMLSQVLIFSWYNKAISGIFLYTFKVFRHILLWWPCCFVLDGVCQRSLPRMILLTRSSMEQTLQPARNWALTWRVSLVSVKEKHPKVIPRSACSTLSYGKSLSGCFSP